MTLYITKLQQAPAEVNYGDIASLNDHEFVFAPHCTHPRAVWGIYKYNLHVNKWTKFIPYPDQFKFNSFQMVINKQTKKIFLCTGRRTVIIDIKSKVFTKYVYPARALGFQICLVMVKSKLGAFSTIHNWGELAVSRSTSWRELNNNNKWVMIKDQMSIFCNLAFYISSNETILAISYTKFHSYSLSSHKWKSTPLPFKLSDPEGILTSDEKHVILHGLHSDKVYILDIDVEKEVYKFRKQYVCIPGIERSFLVKTDDKLKPEMLVSGYFKQVFSTNSLRMPHLPVYIMQFIASWYSMEMLHSIEYAKTKKHHAFYVDNILSLAQK